MKSTHLFAAALAAAIACTQSVAGPVTQGPITAPFVVDFEELGGGPDAGTVHNGPLPLSSGGVSFAQHFAGQPFASDPFLPNGTYDVLGNSANGPLALVNGDNEKNLNSQTKSDGVNPNTTSKVLSGVGDIGFPNFPAIGEGSIAMLFAQDQSEFGIDLIEATEGSAWFSFFARDGSLLDQIQIDFNSLDFSRTYGFQISGSKLLAGVSIHNDEDGGFGIDNVRYNVQGTTPGGNLPEPTSLALAGLALLGLAAAGRRRA